MVNREARIRTNRDGSLSDQNDADYEQTSRKVLFVPVTEESELASVLYRENNIESLKSLQVAIL
jgi:hypothetical protein